MESCPDCCASAREFEESNKPPAELKERERIARAEWSAMTPEQRYERNQKQFNDAMCSLEVTP